MSGNSVPSQEGEKPTVKKGKQVGNLLKINMHLVRMRTQHKRMFIYLEINLEKHILQSQQASTYRNRMIITNRRRPFGVCQFDTERLRCPQQTGGQLNLELYSHLNAIML